MEVRLSVGFDASHQVPMRQRCHRRHGHHWTVTAAVRNRDGDPEDALDLSETLDTIIDEWRDRDLNEMIANFNETIPERLAPWIMERLVSSLSQVALVEVSDGVVTASVRREVPMR